MLRIRVVHSVISRTFRSTTALNIKKVQETSVAPNKIVVQGISVESPRTPFVAKPPKEAKPDACPLCRLGLKRLAYTDVLIISQFMEPDGKMMPIRETQLCGTKYHLVKRLLRQAQECKLLPRPAGWDVYGPWDNLNSYYEPFKRHRDQPMKQVQPDFWRKPRLYS